MTSAPNHEFPQLSKQERECVALGDSGGDILASGLTLYQERLERIVDFRIDPRLVGRVEAVDVLQEAYLEAQKRLDRYLESSSVPLFVWLRGVALDTLIHVQRRHFAQRRDVGKEVSLRHGTTSEAKARSIADALAADMTSASQAAIRDEIACQIKVALDRMDEVDREVLLLRHFEQLSNDEIADVVGVKKAAASRRYIRALKRLREMLMTIPGFDFGE